MGFDAQIGKPSVCRYYLHKVGPQVGCPCVSLSVPIRPSMIFQLKNLKDLSHLKNKNPLLKGKLGHDLTPTTTVCRLQGTG